MCTTASGVILVRTANLYIPFDAWRSFAANKLKRQNSVVSGLNSLRLVSCRNRRILTFILQHEDEMNGLSDRLCSVTAKFRAFSCLRKPLWELVTALEASDGRMAQADYRISSAIREF
jgi:hypothetical protein